MGKIKNLLLLLLCGSFFMMCALGSSEENEYESGSQKVKESVKVTFSEETIYDKNNVVMKVTGSENTTNGTKINIYIENNSNINLNFNAHSYSINGIMARNNIYDMRTDVAAGKKANTSLLIKNSTLKEYNIDYIKYIDILFWAYDDDKMYKSFETDVIKIKSDKYDENNSWIKGTEVYNKKGIKVEYLSINDDKAKYVITNTTGNNLDLTFKGISINDYTVTETDYDLFNEQVLNNNQIVFEIKITNDFKNKNNVTTVNKIDFYLSYTENDNYKTNKTDNITTKIGE